MDGKGGILRGRARRSDAGNGEPEMNIDDQIEAYLESLPQPKRDDMRALHRRILEIAPGCRTWFLDGRNEEGKIVSNPNIGYGFQAIRYADRTRRDFYRIGLSANTTGISVYVMGLDDKTYLATAYGARLGKAKVTGYCIRFKRLADVDMNVLEEAIRFGLEARDVAPA
jgi:hypothetical protein